jgi:Right handed beta helix region
VGKRRSALALALVAAVASVVGMLVVTTASAVPTVVVHEGNSIQDAIDAAAPGTHINVDPGDYQESLDLNTTKVVLTGNHANLMPPETPVTNACGTDVAICVEGAANNQNGVRNFSIAGFTGGGIVVLDAKNTDVSGNVVNDDGSIGIKEVNAAGVNIQNNVVFASPDSGVLVDEAQLPAAVIKNNIVFDDGYGVQVHNSASGGNVIQNVATRNCVGVALFHDNGGSATTSWTVQKNSVVGNDSACPGAGTNGSGILVGGADNSKIIKNTATRNQADGPAVSTSGGIVLFSTATNGGADPVNVTIATNVAFSNQGGDLVWDGSGTGNDLKTSNRCATSSPDHTICKNQHS